ncbi:MAG: type IV toxin-antitoxin system AbiEi family antitoxin domain-containing protein [Pirellulales bacterium]
MRGGVLDVPKSTESAVDRARSVFKQSGGLLRMSAALRAGIHRDTLKKMVQRGDLHRVSRGLYQLVDALPPSHPDLAVVEV